MTHTAPGSTAGWGYSITNNSTTHWLVIYALTATPNSNVIPNPYFFDFPSIAPGASRIVPYDPFSPYGYSFLASHGYPHPVKNLPYDPVTNPFDALGLYQVTISRNAPMGYSFSGSFMISGVWMTGDPDTNHSAQFVSFAADASAPFGGTVAPEPASLSLVGIGIFGMAFGVRLKSRKRS